MKRKTPFSLNIRITFLVLVSMVIPIMALACFIFYSMEKNVVLENENYLAYTMQRNADHVKNCMDAMNMPTQFFLADASMGELLRAGVSNEEISKEKLLNYYNKDVAALERLVNTNPMLYAVRMYSTENRVVEMMPILYRADRMERLSWSQDKENILGWHFGYIDTTFENAGAVRERELACLVTAVNDYQYGVIGYVEASMGMDTLFPPLYEEIEDEWSCYVDALSEPHFGDNAPDYGRESIQSILERIPDKQRSANSDLKYGKKHLVIAYEPLKNPGGALICVKDISEELQRVTNIRRIFVAGMIFVLFFVVLLVNLLTKRMLKQLYHMLETVEVIQGGNIKARVPVATRDELGYLSGQFNTMLDRIEELMEENINRQLLAKNSQIRALQNQINAHFIYNVLETIKMMAEIDEEYDISDAITSLGKLLRYSMKWTSGNVLLSEELEYIRNYLVLINLRFDYEVFLSVNIPSEMMNQEIPKMSLQPIVENAILHGIEDLAADTTIYIKAFLQEERVVIEVTDSGCGMSEEALITLQKKIDAGEDTASGKGSGIGLKNVQDRIHMAFGTEFGLQVASKEGCYTKVSVTMPLKIRTEEEK